MNTCTEERFLNDTKSHSMDVIRDDGVYRHLKFTNGGSQFYRFDLITWPGHLCVTGDCGTYVFSRLKDMFEFFRADSSWKPRDAEESLCINPGYWGEKLLSIDKHSGYTEFDSDYFEERVTDHFDTFWEGASEDLEEDKEGCWREISDDVLSCAEDEHAAYTAVSDFHYKTDDRIEDFDFQDFFEGGGTKWLTFHYLWCLYAIAWGIKKYDESIEAKVA